MAVKTENPFDGAVFIIGAGASKPYGFPTGAELMEEIANLEHHHPDNKATPSESTEFRFLAKLKQLGYSFEDLEKFTFELLSTGASSIDEFLQSFSPDDKHFRLGQYLIYFLISKRESSFVLRKSDWIEVLIKYLMDLKYRDKFLDKPPLFISFNYDNFLKNKIEFNVQTMYRVKDYQFNNIIHVYGQTSGLNYTQRPTEVNKVDNFDEISSHAKQISLIRGANQNLASDSTILKIRQSISEAKKIIILGYGFNKFNNRILFQGESKLKDLVFNNKVIGTGMGLTDGEIALIHQHAKRPEKNPIKKDVGCKQLIESLIPRELF